MANDQLAQSVAHQLSEMAQKKTIRKAISGTIDASEATRDVATTGMAAYQLISKSLKH
jgi:cation transport regulator ChaB